MYFPMINSDFKQHEKLKLVKNQLEDIKEEVNSLVYWNKKYTDECNTIKVFDKEEYNQDYLELQRLINKILKIEKKQDNEGCKGYCTSTPDGNEYGCEYEYSGEISCDDCIFGKYDGEKDPRMNPYDYD